MHLLRFYLYDPRRYRLRRHHFTRSTPSFSLILSLKKVDFEALTISPADQIANELMNRALTSNADFSFEMRPDLTPDTETSALLESTEQLLELRRKNLGIEIEEKKQEEAKTRISPRIARKLRFSKDIPQMEDMDTMD